MSDDPQGLRDKLAKSSEETLGKFAQDLLENPLVTGALTRAFAARERAAGAQEAAMGALNIPSAADVERLTRRLRAVAQRLEGIEDALDKLDRRLETTTASAGSGAGVEEGLATLTQEVRRLSAAIEAGDGPATVSREQERLEVGEKPAAKQPAAKKKPAAAAKKRPAAKKPAAGS